MRYVIVDAAGVVINVVLWAGGSQWIGAPGETPVQSDTAEIGDCYDGTRFAPLAPPALSLEQARTRQHAAINAGFSAATAALTAGYPAAEQISWPTQQAEVAAYQADPTAPTPVLDAIAAARGVDRTEIISKAAGMIAAMVQMAPLIGTRQRLRDDIDKATTPEAVALVKWPEAGA